MCKCCKKQGFTLAEVLITLGIIGVVAALTFPALTANYRKRVIETRLKKFYSTINQAVLRSEYDNESRMDWDRSCSSARKTCMAYMNKYFAPYLVALKIVEDDNGYIITYFSDGSLVAMKDGYDWYFYPFAKDFNAAKLITTDDDGKIVREDCGKTYWAFKFSPMNEGLSHIYHYKKGVEPYRGLRQKPPIEGQNPEDAEYYEYSMELLYNDSQYGCNKSAQFKVYCTAIIHDNNWQIPDDYPLKY